MSETLLVPVVATLLLLPVAVLAARYQGWPHLSEFRSIFSALMLAALVLRAIAWTALSWIFPGDLAGKPIIFERALPASVYEIAAFLLLVAWVLVWNTRISWHNSRAKRTESAAHSDMGGEA